jgi:hypothetical protein
MIKNKKEKIKFLQKKRGSKFIFPAQIKHNLTMNLLEDCFTHDMVLVSPSMMKKHEKDLLELKKEQEKEKTQNHQNQNNSSINPKLKKTEEINDLLIEISEISREIELFAMERRKRRLMTLIEKMAEYIDEDSIDIDELTDLLFFGKKMNLDKSDNEDKEKS